MGKLHEISTRNNNSAFYLSTHCFFLFLLLFLILNHGISPIVRYLHSEPPTPEALIKKADSLVYYPTTKGLKSLVIAIESSNFKNMVKEYNERLPFDPFVIYSYREPEFENFTVAGVPPTHPAVTEKIMGLFKGRGWLVLPIPFSKQLRHYDLKIDEFKDGRCLIKGKLKQKTGDLPVRISLKISKEGLVEEKESISKKGDIRVRDDYRFSKIEGEELYFLTDIITRIDDGSSTTLTIDNLTYKKVEKYFLVEKVIEKVIKNGERVSKIELNIKGYKINK